MESDSKGQAFGVSPSELSALFKIENIRSGQSNALLERIGGIKALSKSLKSNIDLKNFEHTSGISREQNDLKERRRYYGTNEFKIESTKSLPELTYQNFKSDRMIRLLTYASVILLVLGMVTEGVEEGWVQGASILFAVITILVVNSYTSFLRIQNHILTEINLKKSAQVIRNGCNEVIMVRDLLVGDVMLLEIGQTIPADGVLVLHQNIVFNSKDANNVYDDPQMENAPKVIINQQVISNQKNMLLAKSTNEPFILSGSSVISSTCEAHLLVLAVGQNSFYYKISVNHKRETPLEINLEKLKLFFGNTGIYSAMAIFSVMFLRYCYDCLRHPNTWGAFVRFKTLDEIVQYLIVTIGIMVISIPQGLPLAVGITLAYSMKMMQRQNIVVKHLYACETLGNTNTLIVDKTGILTTNEMKVQKVYIEEMETTNITKEINSTHNYQIFRIVLCANCVNAYKLVDGKKIICDRTAYALMEMIQSFGFSSEVDVEGIVKVFELDSEKKIMTTIYEKKFQSQKKQKSVQSDQQYRTYVCSKGMPESLLPLCDQFVDKSGGIVPITNEYKEKLLATAQNFATNGMRVLLVAYKMCGQLVISDNREEYEKDLISIGIIGIKDPLKPNVASLLNVLDRGGLVVRIVTGESKEYAVSIAKEIGILPLDWKETSLNQKMVMDGETFRNAAGNIFNKGRSDEFVQNIETFEEIVKQLKVLTKASFNDKYLLTAGLQQLQNIVGVALTSDGMGDLAILAKADVGISIRGKGIKEIEQTSDILLCDDSFNSVVSAFRWGRNIFNNIRKFLIYQITVNIVALSMSFIGAALNKESPLSSVQMLWVNLIISTLVSLAFATEHPTQKLLKSTGFGQSQKLINHSMQASIASQSVVQIVVLCVILFKFPEWMGIPSSVGFEGWNEDSGRHYAIFFNVFVYFQLFNQLNTRKYYSKSANIFHGFLANKFFVLILVATFLTQLLLANFGGEAVRTIPLSLQENLLCIILGSISLVTGLVVKTVIPKEYICDVEQIKTDITESRTRSRSRSNLSARSRQISKVSLHED